jgi:hypothetical protein
MIMKSDDTACSNCACPLNYDCDRFQQFYEGKYSFVEEYKHNDDYSCNHKRENEQQNTVADSQQTFF